LARLLAAVTAAATAATAARLAGTNPRFKKDGGGAGAAGGPPRGGGGGGGDGPGPPPQPQPPLQAPRAPCGACAIAFGGAAPTAPSRAAPHARWHF